MKTSFILIIYFLSAFTAKAQFNVDWVKAIGGASWDVGYAICATKDSGYIIAGVSNGGFTDCDHGNGDYIIIKFDKRDSVQWQKCYGGSQEDISESILQTLDGGYLVTGYSGSNDGDVSGNHGIEAEDFWILRLDSLGNLLWQKCYGGTNTERAYDAIQTKDKGFMIVGSTASDDGQVTGFHGTVGFTTDMWCVKTDSIGNFEWEGTYGGSEIDEAHGVIQIQNGNYFVGGFAASGDGDLPYNIGGYDFWLLEIDSTGKIISSTGTTHSEVMGGTEADQAFSMCLAKDRKLVMAGVTFSSDIEIKQSFGGANFWVLKVDTGYKENPIMWENNYGGSSPDGAESIMLMKNGDYMVCGTTKSNDSEVTGFHGTSHADDEWTIVIDSAGKLVWQTTIGGSADDDGLAAAQIKDGSFITVGYTFSNDGDITNYHGDQDIMLAKISEIPNGISQITGKPELAIYPNPFTNQVSISFIADKTALKKPEIIIKNILGQEVMAISNLISTTLQINTSKLLPGVYFIELLDREQLVSEKKMIRIF